jgi:hypothetical protein
MSVKNELTGLLAAGRHAHSVYGIVKTALKEDEQVLARHAFLLLSHLVIETELILKNAIVASCLLLLTHLDPVLADLLTGSAVLAGSRASMVDGALTGSATIALQEKLRALSAALLAAGSCISCHVISPPV